MDKTIERFIGVSAMYDEGSQMIFGVDEKGKQQLIADVRGWGAIQNLYKKGSNGTYDMDGAAGFQDKLGQWLADAITEKLQKERTEK